MNPLKIQTELEIEQEFELFWTIQKRLKIIKELLDEADINIRVRIDTTTTEREDNFRGRVR